MVSLCLVNGLRTYRSRRVAIGIETPREEREHLMR